MAVMSLQKTSARSLLEELSRLTPGVKFESGKSFYWSPHKATVTYAASQLDEESGVWSLLHETAHAQLEHTIYKTDFELLLLEVAAWEHAKDLAHSLKLEIDEDHVQDCLDTYRDWLHRRSTCPTCGNVGLQHSTSEYNCHNCNTRWHVTTARFCRPYRRKGTDTKEKSPDSVKNQTTFR